MKQLQDDALLAHYLQLHNLKDHFETHDLNFRLYEYEKGEIINCMRDSMSFLQFIVSGSFQIYAIRKDGSHYPICVQDEFTVLGDMEFAGEQSLEFFVEATTNIHCLTLCLKEHGEALKADTIFLRFLLHSLAHKMAMFSQSTASFSSLEEHLLYYLEQQCPTHQFKGVEAVSTHLRCSRRQLQRLLKDLCEKGLIEKVGKGEYRLV